jgi:hypothetical protein
VPPVIAAAGDGRAAAGIRCAAMAALLIAIAGLTVAGQHLGAIFPVRGGRRRGRVRRLGNRRWILWWPGSERSAVSGVGRA